MGCQAENLPGQTFGTGLYPTRIQHRTVAFSQHPAEYKDGSLFRLSFWKTVHLQSAAFMPPTEDALSEKQVLLPHRDGCIYNW